MRAADYNWQYKGDRERYGLNFATDNGQRYGLAG